MLEQSTMITVEAESRPLDALELLESGGQIYSSPTHSTLRARPKAPVGRKFIDAISQGPGKHQMAIVDRLR